MFIAKTTSWSITLAALGLCGAVGCSSISQKTSSLGVASRVSSEPTAHSAVMTTEPITPINANPSPVASQAMNSGTSSSQVAPTITQVGFRNPSSTLCQSCPTCRDGCGAGTCRACGPATMLLPPPWRVDPQEFLCDGADQNPQAYLSRGDQVMNLQAEDTVSHYTTENGDIEFTASNRVCVYAPRFGSVRQVTGAVAGEKAVAAIGYERPVGPVGINVDLPGLVVRDSVAPAREQLNRRIDSMRDRNRGVIIDEVQQPLQAVDFLAVLAGIQNVGLKSLNEDQLALVRRHAVAAIAWTIDESVEVSIADQNAPVLTRDQKVDALVVYEFPDAGRLNLIKLVDKSHAQLGDVVTFVLRLQNVGDSAVEAVRVADNLTTRLEFVAGSSTVVDPESGDEIEAELSVAKNSAGSSKLIWGIPGELAVGEMVEISFECVVR